LVHLADNLVARYDETEQIAYQRVPGDEDELHIDDEDELHIEMLLAWGEPGCW
jgi:hypothetical protein